MPAQEPDVPGASPAGRPSSASLDGGRFAPGTLLAARYRIVALVGRGGMGEVYRAEDLTLGEQVALKFLPPRLARDADALALLHREVRTSRQVSHRNVVRVHDVGEVDGEPFLSMEFVRGEDLASLLRRIGRLPEEKGVALARQICAGLAAAHDGGVLHRDLKPGNVMVDGDGNAKLTDFGLAALADGGAAGERVGTPAYMAPEQLADGRATRASDVFALGLLLYEVFTGERAVRAATLAELEQVHRAPFPGPAERVPGLDPAIDRAVRRCLAPAPEARPASALAVAAALPGGDPLAQALAAGETPSPELVARAVGPPALPPAVARALLAVGLAALGFIVWFVGGASVYQADGTPLEPAVLEHRARELLDAAGAFELVRGFGAFAVDPARSDLPVERARLGDPAALRPGLVHYVYRAGDGPIAARGAFSVLPQWNDPPVRTPGTVAVRLDSRGRLVELVVAHRARPADARADAEGGPTPGDGGGGPYARWFEAAGLDMGRFASSASASLPPVHADEVRAWTEAGTDALRVEAARLGGRLVWWRLGAASPAPAARLDFRAPLLVFAAMVLVGGWFAVRNVRAGRADLRGATVLAALAAAASLSGSWLSAPRVLVAGGPPVVFGLLATALLFGAGTWGAYAALEPVLRRTLPRTLTSWNRLLRGGVGDPLVHRDLLLGLVCSLADTALAVAREVGGDPVFTSYPHGPAPLLGLGAVLGCVLHVMAVLVPVAVFFLFGAPRLLVHAPRLADALGAALVTLAIVGFLGADWGALLGAAILVTLSRWVGLLALFGYVLVPVTLQLVPVSWDLGLWWAANSLVPPALLVALLVWTAARSVVAVDGRVRAPTAPRA